MTNYSNTDSPWLKMVHLTVVRFFFCFTVMWKAYASSRNCISNFELWSFSWASVMQYDTPSWCWTVLGSCTWNHEDKQLIHLQTFLTHETILLFTFNAAFYKLHEIFNSLLQRRFCIKCCPTVGICKVFEHIQVRLV